MGPLSPQGFIRGRRGDQSVVGDVTVEAVGWSDRRKRRKGPGEGMPAASAG